MVAAVLVPYVLVAVTDIGYEPTVVGVPVMAPVAVLKDKPGAKVPVYT